MSKLNPNIIRKGDIVKVINPQALVRVGYPKTLDDYMAEAEALVPKLGIKFSESVEYKIAREIAYGLARNNHFGGPERTLHLVEDRGLLDREFKVENVYTVMTGTYYPPSGGGYTTWDGGYEDDYEPGGLTNMKPHRIALLTSFRGVGIFWSLGAECKVPVVNLEKINVPA